MEGEMRGAKGAHTREQSGSIGYRPLQLRHIAQSKPPYIDSTRGEVVTGNPSRVTTVCAAPSPRLPNSPMRLRHHSRAVAPPANFARLRRVG